MTPPERVHGLVSPAAGDPPLPGLISTVREGKPAVRLLILAPFPPRLDAMHGAGRVLAQFLLALPPTFRVSLLYLQREGEAPLDDRIKARCEYAEATRLPGVEESAWGQSRRLLRLLLSLVTFRPMWVTDLSSRNFINRVRTFSGEWQPDVVQIEMTAMGQVLSGLKRCAAPRVLVVPEPGVAAAPYLKSAAHVLNRSAHFFDRLAWKRYERKVLQSVEAVIAFTTRDRQLLEMHRAPAPILVIPPGAPIPERPADPLGNQSPVLLFTGNFLHPPNSEAAQRLAQGIFPRVKEMHPDAKCIILGANLPPHLKRLETASIQMTGRVPDVFPYLDQASIVVAPISSGGGVRIKVMEALAAGKAVVASTLAISGLPVQDGGQIALAESDEQFAEKIHFLLSHPEERAGMASNARAWAVDHLRWQNSIRLYEDLVGKLLKWVPGEVLAGKREQVVLPASLVICSRNRPRLLLDTVHSVLQGEAIPAELVIIDQSDQAHPVLSTWENGTGCQIHYLHTVTRGLSRARNAGIAAATYDMIAFTDDDLRVAPDWFASLIAALSRAGSNAAVTGRILPTEPEVSGGFVETIAASDEPKVYQGRIGTDVLTGAQMAMHHSTIERVGWFDERLGVGGQFNAAEDNDYGFRLLEAGCSIVYAPEAVIYHRAWRRPADYYRLRWGYGRGKGGFYTKHASRKDAHTFRRLVSDVLLNCIRFPWRVLHKPRLAVGDLVALAGMLSGALEWQRTQNRPTDRLSGMNPVDEAAGRPG